MLRACYLVNEFFDCMVDIMGCLKLSVIPGDPSIHKDDEENPAFVIFKCPHKNQP